MQAAPGIPVWTIGAILVVGLLGLLAFALVATVLVASRHSLEAWQKLKAMLAVMIWVIPAGALVVWIAQRSDRHFVDTRQPSASDTYQVATTRPMPVQYAQHVDGSITTVSHGPDATMPVTVEADIAPRLKVRRISSDDPGWKEETTYVDGREVHSLSSQRFATLALAEEQATEQLLTRIKAHYHNQFPLEANTARLMEMVNLFAIKDSVGEVIDKWDFGNGITGKMYRAHFRYDFTPQLHDALSTHWRGQTIEHRIGILGGMLGLVTLMLGTAAGYFRLDDATGGKYRGRLKLAAALVVTAGGLATTAFVG